MRATGRLRDGCGVIPRTEVELMAALDSRLARTGQGVVI